MDVTLSPDQEEIRAAARRLLAQRCPLARVRAATADPRGYDPSLWRQMAELGWLGLAIPEAHDGLGLGFLDLCLLIEEQSWHLLPSPFVPTVALGAQAIARFGSAAQQAAHLPAVAAGERIIAIARTGPDGAWDPTRVGVAAARDSGGYTLDGEAVFVDYAHVADLWIAIADTTPATPATQATQATEPDGDADSGSAGPRLSAFLVPADTAGVTTAPLDTVDGARTHRVSFAGVRLSEDAVLGRPGHGEPIARAVASWGAAARCAELVGIGQRVLDMTVEYAGDRTAFGKPIGAFQAVQHHCADMAVDVLASRSVTREAAWRVSTGDARAAEAVSVAKAWASDAIARVCALGHQVHGAIGFTAEHDLHLFSRRARAAELDFGDAAWHRGRLAAGLGL